MSANVLLRISTPGALAIALALGGCAMGGDQHSAGGDTMSAADSCEQQHEAATQVCEDTLDPEINQDDIYACRNQALEELQACRAK